MVGGDGDRWVVIGGWWVVIGGGDRWMVGGGGW